VVRGATFRPVIEFDAYALDVGLRPADRAELHAASGPDTYGTIREAVERSAWCATAESRGNLVAMFGVVEGGTLLDPYGIPWMLATTGVKPGMLMAHSPRYIGEMLARFPRLRNYVDARNHASIRYLRRLGFSLNPPEPFGVAGLPFHRFEKTA